LACRVVHKESSLGMTGGERKEKEGKRKKKKKFT